jgi:uncharacterized membrane protein
MLDSIASRSFLAAGLLFCFAMPAAADLKICNSTTGRVGVALGYQGAKGWVSEGWWTIAGESCETLLKGKPKSRIFYVYAVDYDRGGEWAGQTFMCTDDKAFVIQGNADCERRGHKRAGFMEVDTNNSHDWTIRLGDPPEQADK